MGGRIAITRQASAVQLRKQARLERDGKVALRLIAIAAVLEGARRHEAARQGGMDRQTLRDWVHRFNAGGVEGLRDRPGGHPVRRLTGEQEAQVKAFVLTKPDPDKDRLVRWRCVDVPSLHRRDVQGGLSRRHGRQIAAPFEAASRFGASSASRG